MKNCLILFKREKDYFDTKIANDILDLFAGANFPINSVFTFATNEKEDFDKIFSNIRQAYVNVFIIKCKHDNTCLTNLANLYNENHTANDKSVFIVDEDFKTDVIERVIPALNKKYSVKYGKVVFKVFGLDESEINKKINEISQSLAVSFNVIGGNLDYKVEIVYDDKSTKMDYDYAQKQFINAFRENIYAEKDANLEQILVELLKLRKCVIGVAESFTGGNIASKITSVSGSSSVFYESIVAYNEQSKQLRLQVGEQTLRHYKPVSGQVAGEMAYGIIKEGKVDIAISTTGIAGPNSDQSGFPVGRCYIAVAYDGEVKVYHYEFDGNREEITEKGTKTAIFLAIKQIKNI